MPATSTKGLIMSAVDIDAADQTSTNLNMERVTAISLQFDLNNTDAVGVIYIRVSNDGSNWNNASWVEAGVVKTSIPVATGVGIDKHITLRAALPAKFLHVFYDFTSGGGGPNTLGVSTTRLYS